MVNLDEDYKKYMTRLGREEGLAEGREQGLAEGREQERSKFVSFIVEKTCDKMRTESLSFDDAFDNIGFPEEYREEVRAKVCS